jgi:hypothetical protein
MSESIIEPQRCKRKYREDLRDRVFGRLTVVSEGPRYVLGDGPGKRRWICRCKCGNEALILQGSLTSGRTTSCGCLQRTHGMSRTRLYRIWLHMRERCSNPKADSYPYYGGRGIVVCQRWQRSFAAFLADMGSSYRDGVSIDRIDNALGYSRENCRWVSPQSQANNRRTNARLTLRGETHSIAEWARITGVADACIRSRLRMGWSVTDALTKEISNGTR